MRPQHVLLIAAVLLVSVVGCKKKAPDIDAIAQSQAKVICDCSKDFAAAKAKVDAVNADSPEDKAQLIKDMMEAQKASTACLTGDSQKASEMKAKVDALSAELKSKYEETYKAKVRASCPDVYSALGY